MHRSARLFGADVSLLTVPQVCAACGETQTPTWRRAGGQLLCNACGLRRYRQMAKSDKKAAASARPKADD